MNEKAGSSLGATIGWIIGLVALAAMADHHGATLLLAAAAGYAIAQVLHARGALQSQTERLRRLETEMELLLDARKRAAREAAPAASAAPDTVAETFTASAPAPTALAARAQAPPPVTAPAEPPLEPIPSLPKYGEPMPPSPFDLWLRGALGWFTRGNPLARAGIVVLFFGGAFLAKYAAEHSHFPVEARFSCIAAAALGLLIFGWRLRETRAVYAQTLQGGGVAGLYLTIFAATKLYQLLPPVFALSLMVVVAVTSGVIAVGQNALALAVIGTAGGFMAPILVNTGSGNHIALFTYYAVLNVGIFTVAWFRAWRVLNLLGFVFTFGIAGLFRALSYTDDKLVSTDLFLLLYFLMYVAVSVLFSLRQKADLKGYVSASLVFGLPLAAFGIHTSLVQHIEYALAWSALGLGAFYVALAWALYRSRIANLDLLLEAFAALGVIFASLAVPLAFDAQVVASTWAIEGAGLLWLGVRQQRRLARAFGMLLQLLAGGGYMIGLHQHEQALTPVLNSACMGAAMLALAGLLSGLWLQRNRDSRAGYEEGWNGSVAIWGALWWLAGGLSEIHHWLPQDEAGAALLFLAVSAAALQLLGERWAWVLPSRMALVYTALAAARGLAEADRADHPLDGLTWAGWPALFAVQYFLLWRNERERGALHPPVLGWLHAASVWLLALILAWEAHWRIAQEVSGVWNQLPWGLLSGLALWLLAREPVPQFWPLAAHGALYRVRVALGFAAAGVFWIVVINLHSNGSAEPLPYLPLLNPLDVSVALVLASLVAWWQSLESAQQALAWRGAPGTLARAAALLVFGWLNAALLRAMHHLAGTPLSGSGIAHSTLVQTALSIFWGLLGFGAMVLAARQRRREIWIAGAGLMGVVVAKLFLVDLSGSGTLARIVSFLVVGALLLVTGYLSPLPPRQTETAA